MGKTGHPAEMPWDTKVLESESAVSNVTMAQHAGSPQVWFRQTWAWDQVGGGTGDA